MRVIGKDRLHISTITPDAAALAREYGVGLEIAEFCTAYNMDREFVGTNRQVLRNLEGVSGRILHAPFNELFPCAIDPKARELAASRYLQALKLAKDYAVGKVVIHSGYAPTFYYDCWFVEKSILFWETFLNSYREPMTICLENVLETQPEPLLSILEGVHDSRLGICLDLGHANAYSDRPVEQWLEVLSPHIVHFHVHNNHGKTDSHGHLFDGTMDLETLLPRAVELCPDATFTLEIPDAASDFQWLCEHHLLTI